MLEYVTSGLITRAEAENLRKRLTDVITDPQIARWFAPGLRVLNERSIMQRNTRDCRPDRVVSMPDGSPVVIDYKFGRAASSHIRQVRDYCSAIDRTGTFSRPTCGYLYYAISRQLVPVKTDDNEP